MYGYLLPLSESKHTASVFLFQKGVTVEKAAGKLVLGTNEKKVKILEHQRNEVGWVFSLGDLC